ncbi:MAG TPA: hypothetical protein VHO67_22080 [Polyangia bacterium]|nr:hypothetical protein [Polyangia bacterium]
MQENKYQSSFAQGEVTVWAEDGRVLFIKAVTAAGDPVELDADDARGLAERLLEYARVIEGEE